STTPSLDYGDVRIGRHVDGPLTLCNHGARPVEITQIRLPDSTLTVPLQSPFTVPALGQFQLPLRYSPTAHARISGNLTVETALSELNAKISITGRGVAPILQVTPTSLDFGSVPVGFSSEGRQFAIANVGDAYLDATWE